MTAPLVFSDEAAAALEAGGPIVALESTIVTHGMPWPQNLETAQAVEAEVRAMGATPATIAVRAGAIQIGHDAAGLEALAKTEDAAKLSRADLAPALALGLTGSTTVAATMIAARLAGVEVFATGGVGGVHRGVEETWDISADLTELATTEVVVVCAGAKAILDVPKTLEVLETYGVPVMGYQTSDAPAFWSRRSGLLAPLRMESAGEIAAAHRMRGRLGLAGGALVMNPIPAEDEIAFEALDPLIEEAVAAAEAEGITGKALTPWLLARIEAETHGASLKANIALIRSNARLAAEIATALADG